MRNIITRLILMTALIPVTGCSVSPESQERYFDQQSKERFESNRREVVGLVEDQMVYFKDPHTNLCYAYFWGGGVKGGPALTWVPCDSIPADLLLVE